MVRILFNYTVYIFAGIGFFLMVGYFLLMFGFTNTQGIIDTQTKTFLSTSYTKDEYITFPLTHTKEWIAFRIAVA